ncbi:hypothetical protein DEO72_LG10g230 [Vigna unguiculata]|uniref:Secreted protein n=1 Tax=Vigna unguiculata TaxID=3917 RepID=A0A4D6N848_VIGUN|nr:hypothetical protein DEO72_LG10g230 [Vigna unguiculata]
MQITNKLIFAVAVVVGIVHQSQSDGGSAFSVHCAIFSLLPATWWMSRWRRSGYGQRRRGGQRVSWWPATTWVEEKRVCVWRREEGREEESQSQSQSL